LVWRYSGSQISATLDEFHPIPKLFQRCSSTSDQGKDSVPVRVSFSAAERVEQRGADQGSVARLSTSSTMNRIGAPGWLWRQPGFLSKPLRRARHPDWPRLILPQAMRAVVAISVAEVGLASAGPSPDQEIVIEALPTAAGLDNSLGSPGRGWS